MTKAEKKAWLAAINILLNHYRGQYEQNTRLYPIRLRPCPLCEIVDYYCGNCLWKLWEDEDCMAVGLERNLEERISRLLRWRRRIYRIKTIGEE